MMGQSIAITRYLGAKHGYYPQDPELAYQCDYLVDRYQDIGTTIYKPQFMKDEAEKAEAVKKQVEELLPRFLDEIGDRLESGWLVGDKITIADFFIGGLYTNYLANDAITFGKESWPTILEKYPKFKAYGERYAAENADYLGSRPAYPI